MKYTLPIFVLEDIMSNLGTPIPSELGVPFKRFIVLEKDGEIVVPISLLFIVTEFHDYNVIDELELRWIDGHWNLVINTEQ